MKQKAFSNAQVNADQLRLKLEETWTELVILQKKLDIKNLNKQKDIYAQWKTQMSNHRLAYQRGFSVHASVLDRAKLVVAEIFRQNQLIIETRKAAELEADRAAKAELVARIAYDKLLASHGDIGTM